MLNGSCLCGAISFTIRQTARDPASCHCCQCRKQSGNFWASVQVMDDDLTVTGTPQWYEASPDAKRGFCPTCGSFLFWKGHADLDTGVSLGALDGPSGLRVERHIFTADKGDYYDIPATVPQEEQDT